MASMRKLLAIGAAVCALISWGPDRALAHGPGGGRFAGAYAGGGGGGGHFSGGHFGAGRSSGAHIGGHFSPRIGGAQVFRGARIGGLGGLRIHNFAAARALLGGRHFRNFGRAHIDNFGHARINAFRANRIAGSHIARVHAVGAGGAWAAKGAWNHWGNHNWHTNWHSWHGGWGGWVGPVYWPYFFGDLFAFSFWPYAYLDPFWGYGDWFVWDALFWPGPYEIYEPDYVYGPEPYDIYGRSDRVRVAKRTDERVSRETSASSQQPLQSCNGLAPGLSDLPVDRLEKALQLSGDQRILLHALNLASAQASEIAKAACASAVPLTPLGRLDAVEKRIDSLMEASDNVRAPLEAFYNSLNDEQQAKLRELGRTPVAQARRRSSPPKSDLAALCQQGAERFTQLPIERVQDAVKPTQEQSELFERLKTASADAANQLRSSCPTQTPGGPLDRFDAVRTRLGAMRQAIETVRPPLAGFYAALSDEQKARFNILGAPQSKSSRM